MGTNYLWDTNIVIYYLQGLFNLSGEKFIDGIITSNTPTISAITEIELLCWKTATENDMKILQNFIHDAFVIELEPAIKIKTAELRKAYSIKLPDAIIAATALVYNLTLVSRNSNDFKNVPDLIVVNPFNV